MGLDPVHPETGRDRVEVVLLTLVQVGLVEVERRAPVALVALRDVRVHLLVPHGVGVGPDRLADVYVLPRGGPEGDVEVVPVAGPVEADQ